MPSLTGTWVKDKPNSDSMDPVCELMGLSWILKTAIRIISRMELVENDESFEFTLKAGGILDVREAYPHNGEPAEWPRRDKRKGKHRGRLERTPEGLLVKAAWDDPKGGTGYDLFVLSEDGNALEQRSSVTVGDKTVDYVSRFTRVV